MFVHSFLLQSVGNLTFAKHFVLTTEWFQQQQEFTNEIENTEVDELNKCLANIYVSVTKTDGSYYKKTSLLSIRAALDRHLKAPPNNKKFSICDNNIVIHANKTLNAYLKHLSSTGEIAGTVHKESISAEVIQRLYKKVELVEASTHVPRALMQTAWLFISLYFGKRGRENQAAIKKSILRLVATAGGAEYFELNRNEPGAVLTTKNRQGGIDSTEDQSNSKIFAVLQPSQSWESVMFMLKVKEQFWKLPEGRLAPGFTPFSTRKFSCRLR